jgi:methyltransferase (TIGR00027 family)
LGRQQREGVDCHRGVDVERAPLRAEVIWPACTADLQLRQRFAEDALAGAIERGVRQLVVLGAGLDTFAYRNPHAELKVLEVDHPATQARKREGLAQGNIALPTSLHFAPVDFERQTLAQGLSAAGFDASVPSFFTWLGVVVCLSDEATWATLRFIASVPACPRVVFDYSNPPAALQAADAASLAEAAVRMAASGEPCGGVHRPDRQWAALSVAITGVGGWRRRAVVAVEQLEAEPPARAEQ